MVVAMVLFVSGVALLWSKSRPRIYQASSMLEFDPNPVRPIGNQQDPTTGWMFYLDSQEMYQTQFTIVTSDTVLTKVVREHGASGQSALQRWRRAGPSSRTKTRSRAARGDHGRAGQEQPPLLRSRRRHRPGARRPAPHAVAHAYVDHNLEKGVDESSDAALWLGGQVDHYNTELEASENALHEFKEKNELPSSTVEEVSKMIRLEMQTYDDALTHTRTKRKELEAREAELAKVTIDNVDVLPASELLTSGFLQSLRTQYLAANEGPSGASRERQGREPPAREGRRRAHHAGEARARRRSAQHPGRRRA